MDDAAYRTAPRVRTDADYRTIPQVLTEAARRDPAGIWLRTDDGSMTFAAAAAQVAATAAALRAAGVERGDHVLVTARTTGPYLLCWLALAWAGAVTVSANPRSKPAELAGLAQQTTPQAIITDAGLMPLVTQAGITGPAPPGRARPGRGAQGRGGRAAAGSPPAAAGGQPRRRGRAHSHLRHDRPVQAGHTDPPRLCDGRGGVPVLDGADGGRPADDLAAAVPHQRPRVLGDGLARLRRRADPAAAFFLQP